MADREQDELGEEIDDFRRRVAELESARGLPVEERLRALDAALFELRHAADELWPRFRALTARGDRTVTGGAGRRQEDRLMRALFQEHPLPVALLDREAVVRRLNHSAARLVAVGPEYATGRPLTGFLRLADRAALRSQVAAVARGEGNRSMVVRLLPGDGGGPVLGVTLVALRPPGETRNAVMAVFQAAGHVPPGSPGGRVRPAEPPLEVAERGVELLDLLDDVACALLSREVEPLDAAVPTLRRRAADWAIADRVAPDGSLRRAVVLGPDGVPGLTATAADLAAQDPAGSSVVVTAATTGAVAVQVRPDDVECLGRDRTGSAVIARLGVTSLVCLPVCETPGRTPVLAVLTLLRTAKGGHPAFSMAEAGVLDRAARLVALALASPRQDPGGPRGARTAATTPRP
jgi:PAS domain-containing protein